jgi:predicted outer membrane repeat protein
MILFCSGNNAGSTGGAMMIQGSSLITYALSAMIFDRNKCSNGGALQGLGDSVRASLDLDGSFQFRNNSAINGGGLYSYRCNVILRGQFFFEGTHFFLGSTPIPDEEITQAIRRSHSEEVVPWHGTPQLSQNLSQNCTWFVTVPTLEAACCWRPQPSRFKAQSS